MESLQSSPRPTPSIRRLFTSNMFHIAAVSLGLWCVIWIHGEYRAFRDASRTLRENHIESRKEMLRNQVNNVVDYIQHMRGQTEERLKQEIRERVGEAIAIAEHLYMEYGESLSRDRIAKLIADALRPIRFNDGRGYYFAFDRQGVETLFPVRPELEGTNMLELRGGRGEYVVQDMIELVAESGEGFYQYAWTMPGRDGYFPKIAFVRAFAPLDWIIGTGEYLDDTRDEIQREVLRLVTDLRFESEGYFFGSTYEGGPLFSNGRITVGTGSIWDLTDPHGVKIIQEQVRAARNPEGDFVRYVWPKLDSPAPSPKISYVRGIDEWRWTVGAGVYVDTAEAIIAENESRLLASLLQKVLVSLLILFLLYLLIFYWAAHISRRLNAGIDAFAAFFRKAAGESTRIDPATLPFLEFQDIADSANRMIAERKAAETEKQALEAQLQQKYKMEAIGTLTGGIAHDFNNILGIILGNAELAIDDLPEGDTTRNKLEKIQIAGFRARDVVRQLLSFTRKSAPERKPVHPDLLIQEALALVRSSVPSSVEIDEDIRPAPFAIMAEPTQVHQVLLNLMTNAVHAMEPDGGRLTVRLDAVTLDAEGARRYNGGLAAGDYARLTVSDTGQGMEAAVMARSFDPYFTTKASGKGTGMGLTVVHGIVKSHEGGILARSAPGKGATFEVLFKAVSGTPEVREEKAAPRPVGAGRVMVVDDEPAMADMALRMLERLGYSATRFTDPVAAAHEIRTHPERYDLVITDMTMPRMSGAQLARAAMDARPGLPVLIATGYSEKMDEKIASSMGCAGFLEKPYDMARLGAAARQGMEGRDGTAK